MKSYNNDACEMSQDDIGISDMSKNIKKNLFLEREELGTVRKQMLGPKAASSAKLQALNHHRLLFFLTHLFCCGCYPCKICDRNKRIPNININLSSTPEATSPVPSTFTASSENVEQKGSKFSGSSIYQPSFDNDSKQRRKFFIANF